MRLLLIDDDLNLSKVISYQLEKRGYAVTTANSGNQGLKLFEKNDYDIVITDLQMPGLNGIEILEKLRKTNQRVIIIIITAFGSIETALEACKLGADDYLSKPFAQEQLFFVLEKAVRFRSLRDENRLLRSELVQRYRFENIISECSLMNQVLRTARQVAGSEATVLLLGESGTGKELVARAIHYSSARNTRPFITVNCPSVPETLMESELFGHNKGAFTGATNHRAGKFELAQGGTLFLDEIGDMKEGLQAKLLRVLQEREIERLGSEQPLKVDVRIIAATNKDLPGMIEKGRFREDLFYRLSVVPISIPPLRDRRDDIPPLIEYFVEHYGGSRQITATAGFREKLIEYDWPGNVRELENAIERAIVLSDDDCLDIDSLPPQISNRPQKTQTAQIELPAEGIGLNDLEKELIVATLDKTGGNRSRAAQLLKVPLHVLSYRLKKYDLQDYLKK